jgi:hypothetical protein
MTSGFLQLESTIEYLPDDVQHVLDDCLLICGIILQNLDW